MGKELKSYLDQYIKPHLKKRDKPFNRQLFNDIKDMLHKDGVISEHQAQNWNYPKNKWFE
jgi:hypothetical protein